MRITLKQLDSLEKRGRKSEEIQTPPGQQIYRRRLTVVHVGSPSRGVFLEHLAEPLHLSDRKMQSE